MKLLDYILARLRAIRKDAADQHTQMLADGWKEVLPDDINPPGQEYHMSMQTGRSYARPMKRG